MTTNNAVWTVVTLGCAITFTTVQYHLHTLFAAGITLIALACGVWLGYTTPINTRE